jgi:MerR family transcriptional regulator, thiopeptide resistance regulator
MLTVKQLSDLAGVTPRTLHHYDQIGLLKPSRTGENGYRYYGEESILKLQQILLYRELGLALADIKKIMGGRDFEILSALETHKAELGKRIIRLERLVQTVDNTLWHLKGKKEMNNDQIFSGFSEEQQEKYAAEAEKLYDPEIVRASNKKWKGYSDEQQQRILDEGRQVYVDMIVAMPKGADSPEVQALVERWRIHMDYFWTPSLDQLIALAEGYNNDPRFKANFDRMDPRLAAFMLEAVKAYVMKKKPQN